MGKSKVNKTDICDLWPVFQITENFVKAVGFPGAANYQDKQSQHFYWFVTDDNEEEQQPGH